MSVRERRDEDRAKQPLDLVDEPRPQGQRPKKQKTLVVTPGIDLHVSDTPAVFMTLVMHPRPHRVSHQMLLNGLAMWVVNDGWPRGDSRC